MARGRAGVPARGIRPGRPPLRARHLEHEGRARLLRRGGASAAGRRRAAPRGRARRGRLRRDREDAAGRRGRRRDRGYAAGTRYLVSHGGVADMCLLGEPTEGKVVLGHFGALWLRIRVHGNFIHTAFSEGRRAENAIVRQQEVLAAVMEWVPTWEDDPANGYRGAKAIVNVGAIEGGFGWRVSRTPHHADLFLDVRVPPTKPMAVARGEVLGMVRGLRSRFPEYGVEGEVYVTAPGAEIEEGHELVARSTPRTRRCSAGRPDAT